MIILDNPEQFHMQDATAVTIGKFDGLHRGHQLLLEKAQACREQGLKACVFTFDFSDFLVTQRPSILTFDEAAAFLRERYEIDYLIRMPVSKAFFDLSYRTFLEKNLLDDLKMRKIICGDDFCFGYNRRGTPDILRQLSGEYGYDVDIVPRLHYKDDVISSTRIRQELHEGKIEDANACLGYTYTVSGEVVHGRHLAGEWGMPTANIEPDPLKLLPRYGVYAVSSDMDGQTVRGIANIGVRPTVADEERALLEVHFEGFEGDLYGKRLDVRFESFIRPEIRFETVEELIRQMHRDAAFLKNG